MLTADQLLAHVVGDYLLQSDWMANEKTRRSYVAALHAVTYALPFLLITASLGALLLIVGTHFVIDRWRLARFVVWAKNALAPAGWRYPWADCSGTGYHRDRPAWLATWLLIIADNVLHVFINGLAIRFWG